MNQFLVSGDVLKELSDQEVDMRGPQTAGGIFTIPTTSTVGRICTISAECNGGRVCGIG